ncbi:MAG: hypothetical protein KGI98_02460 [Euryarchaeota archaeon]|nr:hypothetical protein [Euryarchaeota archaeon]
MMVAPRKPSERERFAANHVWFEAHLPELLERYGGLYVAVDQGSVLAAVRRVRDLSERFGKDPAILIEKVARPEDEIFYCN